MIHIKQEIKKNGYIIGRKYEQRSDGVVICYIFLTVPFDSVDKSLEPFVSKTIMHSLSPTIVFQQFTRLKNVPNVEHEEIMRYAEIRGLICEYNQDGDDGGCVRPMLLATDISLIDNKDHIL